MKRDFFDEKAFYNGKVWLCGFHKPNHSIPSCPSSSIRSKLQKRGSAAAEKDRIFVVMTGSCDHTSTSQTLMVISAVSYWYLRMNCALFGKQLRAGVSSRGWGGGQKRDLRSSHTVSSSNPSEQEVIETLTSCSIMLSVHERCVRCTSSIVLIMRRQPIKILHLWSVTPLCGSVFCCCWMSSLMSSEQVTLCHAHHTSVSQDVMKWRSVSLQSHVSRSP